MKRTLLATLATCFALALSAQQLYVGTYNIRNHNSDDDRQGDVWAKRCQVIADQVNFESPDIFGTQEVLVDQLNDLDVRLDGYGHIGVGRDDGKQAGEYSAIFYKKDRLRLLHDGHFWLSQTPDRPALGWDAVCIRICTWGEFEQIATGLKFFFFTLHTDHVGVEARRESMKLILERIKDMTGGEPVVVTGDFNVDQRDESYRLLATSGVLRDSYEVARLRFAENGTFNDFKTAAFTDSRIDHVFVSPHFAVDRYAILTNSYWTPLTGPQPDPTGLPQGTRRNPSDHYPVFVHLEVAR